MGGRRRGHCLDIGYFAFTVVIRMKRFWFRFRAGGGRASEPHASREGSRHRCAPGGLGDGVDVTRPPLSSAQGRYVPSAQRQQPHPGRAGCGWCCWGLSDCRRVVPPVSPPFCRAPIRGRARGGRPVRSRAVRRSPAARRRARLLSRRPSQPGAGPCTRPAGTDPTRSSAWS